MATAFQKRLDLYREQQEEVEQGVEPLSNFQKRLQQHRAQNPNLSEPEVEEPEGPTWLQKNLDVPAGMAGGLAGAGLGMALGGPPGAVVGGIAGGALGTAGGTVVSETQFKEAEDIDAYSKAVENALWSMGFDLATLGIASKVKPMYYAAKHKLGLSAEQTAKEIVEGAYGAGSRESLQASQAILNQGGATLLPSQVRSSGLENFKERIASVGLISRQTMEDNSRAVNEVVQDELTTLINRNAPGMDADPYVMGEAFYSLIKAGEDAIQQSYLKGLDEIKTNLGVGLGQRVDAATILDPITKYLKNKKGEAVDELSPESIDFLNQQLSRLRDLPEGTFPVSELITLDKSFTQRVTAKFGPEGAERNAVVQAELADVATQMREAIYDAMVRVSPDAAESYKVLKSSYGEGINALYPRINKGFIRAANQGSYLGLGSLAAKATNLNQLQALRGSLQTAFKEASKDSTDALPFGSASEIDELFKRGFLSSRLSSVFNEKFLITDLKSLANKLDIPAENAKFKYILGKDYGRFRQMMNIVLEASESASGDFGILMLRSAEAGGVRGIAGQLASAATAGGAAAAGFVSPAPVLAAGAAALFIPQVFAKIATNPAYINRLIALTGKKSQGVEATSVAAQLLVADVFYSMADEEKNEMMRYLSEVAKQGLE
jgi:hypothetical protein